MKNLLLVARLIAGIPLLSIGLQHATGAAPMLPILEGATETLKKTSVVVVEAPLQRSSLPHVMSRASFLLERGFFLVDIVDLAYYRGLLSQVDLIFVRSDVVHDIDALRPWETTTFDRTQWYPYTRALEGEPRQGGNVAKSK